MKEQTLGDYLRKRRLELDLTQAEVAKKVKVAQNFVAYLENDQRKPSHDLLKKLAEVLNLPSGRLYVLAHPEMQEMISVEGERIQSKMSPALEDLRRDTDLRRQHAITDQEIDQLASIRARGEIRKKEDYVFLLMSIRQVFK